jgi:hypothetical protein
MGVLYGFVSAVWIPILNRSFPIPVVMLVLLITTFIGGNSPRMLEAQQALTVWTGLLISPSEGILELAKNGLRAL